MKIPTFWQDKTKYASQDQIRVVKPSKTLMLAISLSSLGFSYYLTQNTLVERKEGKKAVDTKQIFQAQFSENT